MHTRCIPSYRHQAPPEVTKPIPKEALGTEEASRGSFEPTKPPCVRDCVSCISSETVQLMCSSPPLKHQLSFVSAKKYMYYNVKYLRWHQMCLHCSNQTLAYFYQSEWVEEGLWYGWVLLIRRCSHLVVHHHYLYKMDMHNRVKSTPIM